MAATGFGDFRKMLHVPAACLNDVRGQIGFLQGDSGKFDAACAQPDMWRGIADQNQHFCVLRYPGKLLICELQGGMYGFGPIAASLSDELP